MVPSLLVVKSDSLYFALHPGFTKVFFFFSYRQSRKHIKI